ncbi:vanadium-dependent haloperoxidase [Lyngbya aestuarii]|uniref:vanadium-dependent haloperoxidase n=1 Tax=Lyngbya aestuarii TaxID=118322 RepID=UPI00403DDB8B
MTDSNKSCANSFRRNQAREIRLSAAELAFQREHPEHIPNGEEYRYRHGKDSEKSGSSFIANFTKGLPHDQYGLAEPKAYRAFVRAINSGDPRDFESVPHGPGVDPETKQLRWYLQETKDAKGNTPGIRQWESPTAGLAFDLEGPDAQSVTMPPAPKLDSDELIAEMAEIYWMALLRDVPFCEFESSDVVKKAIASLNKFPWFAPKISISCEDNEQIHQLITCLNQLPWFDPNTNINPKELNTLGKRKRGEVTLGNLFRGITQGDSVGPYISQFLLIGNKSLGFKSEKKGFDDIQAGKIKYGAITIDQRIRSAKPGLDYVTDWLSWLDVQNGINVKGKDDFIEKPRFLSTPRDLATYVHFDALYQAYLNACLIMLGLGVPKDPGLPFTDATTQEGFAHFGDPHILTLVTEVATRALKAVRFQKFNTHRRLRPEATGGLYHLYDCGIRDNGVAVMEKFAEQFNQAGTLVEKIRERNYQQNGGKKLTSPRFNGNHNLLKPDSLLLPMAFPEGSPMHPAYGAGHATVAGACVTILKAFFDHGYQLPLYDDQGNPCAYVATADGKQLKGVPLDAPLTVEGELNKLASNIAIGRNMAGVHYFTDYIESLRMGEKIAIGILEEQKLTYGEKFTMTIPLFDGSSIRI